ncbi:MAG: hypothetical protein OXB93_01180 [Cytophagales bacterium]|nr:hypothetical protein [Cytophagales bacterium]
MNLDPWLSKYLLILLLVAGAAYMLIRYFKSRKGEAPSGGSSLSEASEAVPDPQLRSSLQSLTIQACERLCLFLERINPPHLVPRLYRPEISIPSFHSLLITEIRREYEYNMSQQIYLSEKTWTLIQATMEEILAHLRIAAERQDNKNPSADFIKDVFQLRQESENDLIKEAIQHLREEIHQLG